MPEPFNAMSPQLFLEQIADFSWRRRVWRVDMHHTFDPDHARWAAIGSRVCVEGMCRYHVRDRGFSDIAQHVSVMPDGEIWTGRDWNTTPASVGFGMNRGVFMLEVVGNFDHGHDRLEGVQLKSVLTVIRGVQCRFGLPPEALLFHREVPQTDKTCPGSSVLKPDMLAALRDHVVVKVPVVCNLKRLPLETATPLAA